MPTLPMSSSEGVQNETVAAASTEEDHYTSLADVRGGVNEEALARVKVMAQQALERLTPGSPLSPSSSLPDSPSSGAAMPNDHHRNDHPAPSSGHVSSHVLCPSPPPRSDRPGVTMASVRALRSIFGSTRRARQENVAQQTNAKRNSVELAKFGGLREAGDEPTYEREGSVFGLLSLTLNVTCANTRVMPDHLLVEAFNTYIDTCIAQVLLVAGLRLAACLCRRPHLQRLPTADGFLVSRQQAAKSSSGENRPTVRLVPHHFPGSSDPFVVQNFERLKCGVVLLRVFTSARSAPLCPYGSPTIEPFERLR